ncbi:MAG TPA: RNA 2',3'-cyclic phosphodiesterase [Methylophilus sp.]|nr:RNA 2',3'-cyclic phosphodiesterase [Methylophilus sp.]HQQ32973.1 RNA 2',3'-cyclic phosphodiesterase [Methylophilus sp.]
MGTRTSNPDVARVFFALWPQAKARQALHKLALGIQPLCKGRVMVADNLHLTLLFLGEVERTRLPQLMQIAGNVSAPAFAFALDKLAFWRHNRIAYAAPQVTVPALVELASALRQQLKGAGELEKSEKFAAHVTLIRNAAKALESQAITPIAWAADSFVLVESVSTEKGVRYQILHKWPLNVSGGE